MSILITLAQLPLSFPDPLPSGPWLEVQLFERPWSLVILISIAGCVAWWLVKQHSTKWAWLSLLISFALAGSVYLTSRFVVTQREVLASRTFDLVTNAMAGGNNGAAAIDNMLANNVRLILLGSETNENKASLVSHIRNDVTARYSAKSSTVRSIAASIDGTNSARSQVRIDARSEVFGGSQDTWWLLTWRRESDGQWVVLSIDAQQIGLLPKGSLRGVRP